MESGIYPKLYFAGEARGKAHVHVVIIGFAACDRAEKQIYDYDADGSHVTVTPAKNISPYLVEGNGFAVTSRTTPICAVPAIINGSKQVDGGFLMLTQEERQALLANNPDVAPYVREFLGS